MRKDVGKFGISDKRGREATSQDPFSFEKSPKDRSLCKKCHNFFLNNRWDNDREIHRQLSDEGNVHWILCPSCRKATEGYAEGVLTLSGDYLWKHEDEIRRLLKNEEEKCCARNPLERVVSVMRDKQRLVMETTGQKLAEHLGKAVQRAHQGEFEIQWGGCPEVCRVSWERKL